MSNIIVVGDSFCSAVKGWPGLLANLLNLELISWGAGGAPWWMVRDFLLKLEKEKIENCSVVVACHTNAERIPSLDLRVCNPDSSNNEEIKTAVKYYRSFIENNEFLHWAQIAWFKEFSTLFSHCKVVNLHCFEWSLLYREHLRGVNICNSLVELSLKEIGKEATRTALISDSSRLNHFNKENNQELAEQLYKIINNYSPVDANLDLKKFVFK
jgi:hypothetical protein